MVKQESSLEFHREPLRFLDQAFPDAEALWLPGRQLCVGEPAAARAVLANGAGLYDDHSDFFHTRRGTFGPRAAQEEMGRASRALLRAHVAAQAGELEEKVIRALVPDSEWPDAGNWIIYRHLASALLAPDRPGPVAPDDGRDRRACGPRWSPGTLLTLASRHVPFACGTRAGAGDRGAAGA